MVCLVHLIHVQYTIQVSRKTSVNHKWWVVFVIIFIPNIFLRLIDWIQVVLEFHNKKLKLELEDLKNVQRPKVVEAIAEARSHGDLKENAEYHAAKEQQGLIEGRVLAINDLIARANVIDVTKIENNGKVIFGSTTKLKDLETDKEISYKLVGQDEADIKKNLIFFKSPIGKALIGKDKSEMVTVNTPSGEKNFEILDVEYI